MGVVLYSDSQFEHDGSAQTINIALNSQAITDINANNELLIMFLIEPDFKGDSSAMWNIQTSGSPFANFDGSMIYMSEQSGTSSDPLIGVSYTDGSNLTHYSDGSGNYDDIFFRGGPETSEANLLAQRNAESSDAVVNFGLNALISVYNAGTSGFVSRVAMRFPTDASKTASSGFISLKFLADIPTGFICREAQGYKIYACKMSSDVSTSFGVEDWSHLEGWASSGSYETIETPTDSAIFFGTNF